MKIDKNNFDNLKKAAIMTASIILLILTSKFEDHPASKIISVAIGTAIFGVAVYLAHNKLVRRNKNGLWLIIFFGPAIASISSLTLIPQNNQKMMLLAVILIFCTCAPFALWGVIELLSKSKNKNDDL